MTDDLTGGLSLDSQMATTVKLKRENVAPTGMPTISPKTGKISPPGSKQIRPEPKREGLSGQPLPEGMHTSIQQRPTAPPAKDLFADVKPSNSSHDHDLGGLQLDLDAPKPRTRKPKPKPKPDAADELGLPSSSSVFERFGDAFDGDDVEVEAPAASFVERTSLVDSSELDSVTPEDSSSWMERTSVTIKDDSDAQTNSLPEISRASDANIIKEEIIVETNKDVEGHILEDNIEVEQDNTLLDQFEDMEVSSGEFFRGERSDRTNTKPLSASEMHKKEIQKVGLKQRSNEDILKEIRRRDMFRHLGIWVVPQIFLLVALVFGGVWALQKLMPTGKWTGVIENGKRSIEFETALDRSGNKLRGSFDFVLPQGETFLSDPAKSSIPAGILAVFTSPSASSNGGFSLEHMTLDIKSETNENSITLRGNFIGRNNVEGTAYAGESEIGTFKMNRTLP